MKKDIFASLRLVKDQDVMVESSNGKFYGKFVNLANEGNRLNLREVRAEDGHKTGNFKFFFKKDILAVKIINQTVEASNSSESSDSSLSNLFVKSSITSPHKLSEEQRTQILKNINHCVYIQQTDVKYFDAIADISRNFVIGFDAEGTGCGRVFKTNLMTITTNDKIYIFDVLALNVRECGAALKKILESDEHLKIVYNCRGMLDNLKTHLNIKLAPVSDLLLFSALFYEKHEIFGLKNCTESVLREENVVSDKEISLIRPISQAHLQDIAAKTAYHLPMHQKLVQKDFSSRMLKASNDFLNQSYDSDGLFESIKTSYVEKDIGNILKMQSQSTPKQLDFNVYADISTHKST